MRTMFATMLLMAMALPTSPATAAEKVTLNNFVRAETDTYFQKFVNDGCFGKLCHVRVPTPVEKQPVIRMQRDTLYSSVVLDLTSPATITLPASGRFQSALVINQDHLVPLVAYGPGSYTLTREQAGTRYVALLFRTFVDANSPADIKAANAAQDAVTITQADKGAYVAVDWDQEGRAKLSKEVNDLMPFAPQGSVGMFGAPGKVDPVLHFVGTASGWGGNPVTDAIYAGGIVQNNDGRQAYTLTVKDVPVDGFWSVIVYNEKGFFEAPESAVSVNNVTAKRNKDKSVTIRFGGDPKAANHLRIMPGWGYIVRLYRPRAEILDGSWTFPKPEPVR